VDPNVLKEHEEIFTATFPAVLTNFPLENTRFTTDTPENITVAPPVTEMKLYVAEEVVTVVRP
jgi:hypothetical protein